MWGRLFFVIRFGDVAERCVRKAGPIFGSLLF
jgi:hypothetical protein